MFKGGMAGMLQKAKQMQENMKIDDVAASFSIFLLFSLNGF